MRIKRGIIRGLAGSYHSGIAILGVVDNETKELVKIPCENGQTIRALNNIFPGFIVGGYCADEAVILNKEIFYWYDDLGLLLAGIAPVCDETIIQFAHWEEQNESEKHG